MSFFSNFKANIKVRTTILNKNKKCRNTLIVFFLLTAVFTTLGIIFANALPKTTYIKSVDKDNIEGMSWDSEGNRYLLFSENEIVYRDLNTDEIIQTINHRNEINSFIEENNLNLISGSLNNLLASYIEGEDKNYILVYDNMANFFKYEEVDGQFVLSNDYYLREQSCGVRLISGRVSNTQYFITSVAGLTKVEDFDFTNLNQGPLHSKYVWDNTNNGNGTQTISHIKTDSKYWDISYADGDIYLTQAFGIFKINECFSDYDDFSYLEKMYDEYPSIYINLLKSDLKEANPTIYTEEKLAKMNQGDLERVYADVTGKKKADAKESAKNAFIAQNPWCTDIDYDLGKVTVKNEYLDASKYSIVRANIYTNAAKICYYKNQQSFIIASVYDDALYEANLSDVKNISILDNKTLDDVATKLDVSFGGKKFAEYNPLTINDYAGVFYISFLSNDTLTIIDASEKGNYKTLYSFQAAYDILSYCGNKDTTILHYLIYDKSVSLDNVTTTFKAIYTINPTQTKYQSFFKISMIISFVFAGVSLIVTIVSLVAGISANNLRKLITLGKDLKRNKWVYIALIPFVALLIMFCYYEAVGSISLSFFDYTRANPSMKWNNFANYIHVFNSGNFLLSIANMLFFLAGDLILSIIPPLIYAFFLSVMKNKKYSKTIRSLLLIPGIIPGIASLLIWRTGIFGEYGVLNTIVKLFNGQPVEWLANVDISRWSLLLMGFPFVGGYLIIYGGMMNIPKDYYEEGELSGISIWKRFTRIDIPLVMPQLKYIFIMNFIASVQNYSRTYMLKSTGTVTLAENMYLAMTSINSDYGLAAAYATLIFIFLFFAVAANFRLQKKNYLGDN